MIAHGVFSSLSCYLSGSREVTLKLICTLESPGKTRKLVPTSGGSDMSADGCPKTQTPECSSGDRKAWEGCWEPLVSGCELLKQMADYCLPHKIFLGLNVSVNFKLEPLFTRSSESPRHVRRKGFMGKRNGRCIGNRMGTRAHGGAGE